MLVITDVTSRIGSRVAIELLRAGVKVRGTHEQREAMAHLKSEGLELAVGEPVDPVFLSSAFNGADTVLLIAPARPETESFREQFRRFGDAAHKAINDSTVKNVLFLSCMGTDQTSEAGLILGLSDIEKSLSQLSVPNITFFHPGYFMEHFLSKISSIKNKDSLGDSVDGQTPLYMVCIEDVVNNIVTIHKQNAFYGRSIVELYGDTLNYRQATRLIGNSVGIPELPYMQLLDQEMRNELILEGFSINMANAYVEMTHALSRGAVSPTLIDRNAPNCPTSFKQFVEKVFVPAFETAV